MNHSITTWESSSKQIQIIGHPNQNLNIRAYSSNKNGRAPGRKKENDLK